MIQMDIRSPTKKTTPTPTVGRNPTPIPPKNLRLRNPTWNIVYEKRKYKEDGKPTCCG